MKIKINGVEIVPEVLFCSYCRIIAYLKPNKGDTPIRANRFRTIVWNYMKESCLCGKGYHGGDYDPRARRD